ncbi:MAG: hypothetical protein ACYTHJ_08585 [Planctomycetota bacterium]|jgi:hypothetical protein
MWATPDGRFVVTGAERGSGGIQVYEITDNGDSLSFRFTDSFTYPQGEVFSVHVEIR